MVMMYPSVLDNHKFKSVELYLHGQLYHTFGLRSELSVFMLKNVFRFWSNHPNFGYFFKFC